jgi:hypothetical protein
MSQCVRPIATQWTYYSLYLWAYRLLFWSVSDTCYNVKSLSKDFEKTVATAQRRQVSKEDMDLLMQCKIHMYVPPTDNLSSLDVPLYRQAAAEDDLWYAIQANVHVPYLLSGFPSRRFFEAWTRTSTSPNIPSDRLIGYIHTDRLEKMRQSILDHPFYSEDRLIMLGNETTDFDRQLESQEQAEKHRSPAGNTKKKLNTKSNDFVAGRQKVHASAKEMTTPSKVKEIQQEQQAAAERQNVTDDEDGNILTNDSCSTHFQPPSLSSGKFTFLSSSPLARMRIRSSTSSKLNYILNEVITHCKNEKFLIFSQHPLSLAHVADGLKLISVEYLQLTSQVDVRRREQLPSVFETSDRYRVLLIDLKYGARGLYVPLQS